MGIEQKGKSPSSQVSILKNTRAEASRRKQQHKILPTRPNNILQRQPLPVMQDELEPKIEKNITKEEAKALISGYSPEVLHRWQQSIVKKSSIKAIIDDGSILYQKLRAQFFRLKGRMPELKDLIEMSDQALEEMMAGSKKKEEMTAIRQLMVQHNVLPSNSQMVFEIDLLGLPERVREKLITQNIKTIKSICQLIGKKPDLDEEAIEVSISIKNQLLRFLQELVKWEKAGFSPEGLPTSLKQSGPPILEKKQRQIIERPKKPRGKKQAIFKEYGLKDINGNITETWFAFLDRLCKDLPLQEVATFLGIHLNTLLNWRKEAHSTMETKRINLIKLSPEEKKELTGLAYLQVMFPGRLGTRTYNTLKKKNNINTLEELKSILPNIHLLTGIGPKGIQACVDLLRHFFPDDDQIINALSLSELTIARAKEQATEPLPQIDQQTLEKWQELRQNETELDKIGLPDNILNVFQEAGWTLEKIINIPDGNLLRLLGGDIRKLIAVRRTLIDNNIVSKNSDLTTELNLLGLPTRTIRALRKAGIKTIKELYSLTEGQLLSIKGMGRISLGLIRLNLTRLKNELETIVSETGATDSA